MLSIEMIMKSIGEWRSLLPLLLIIIAFVLSGANAFWLGPAIGGEHALSPFRDERGCTCRAERVAQEFVTRLLAADREGEALSVVRAQLRTNANFRPRASDELARLVRIANDAKDVSTASALTRDSAGVATPLP